MDTAISRERHTLAHRRPGSRNLALAFVGVITSVALATPAMAVETGALFEQVTNRAKEMAASPYEEASAELPEALSEMDYDRYRQIRYRDERALWKDDGDFEVELFHPGFLYDQPVDIHLLEDGEVRSLPFESERFRYDDDAADLAELDLSGLGYAGFRLHYPLNRADYKDEFAVFLGASYFRLVGRDQGYGLSARGLAIDTALPQGEEFPAFREYWLVKPQPGDTHMTVLALLDSPSLAGAYRFDITPGKRTQIDTEARLFAREDVEKLGVAPLTSMFLHGEMDRRQEDDYRIRVHDSSGLLMATSTGEWTWRVLENPESLQISGLQDTSPKGYGLVQRPQHFNAYLDMEARYERRPSQWVEPQGEWGEGHVELVEIPTDSEAHDNITAYWVPATPLMAGDSRTYRYRTWTFGDTPTAEPLARVVRSRQGWGGVPGQSDPPDERLRQFIIDFRGGELEGLDPSQPVEMTLTTSSGETAEAKVTPLPDDDTWRASFTLLPDGDQPADIRLTLMLRGERLSETWNSIWSP
ncbi:glucan biosynthesis protein [Halomonas sp. DN3]|uniref:glucan biosynthesis protein n=1 Tax=Halomonas sp. DN3 TaxID=2953657 RepID=UPI00209E6403|nr:glucan biosynthesis protein [Halomonas sp. DN3]USZ51041.1 glucan biosynthesis protein [Halomonas sp. DN3]